MVRRVRRTKETSLTEKAVTSLAVGRKKADGTPLPGGGRLIVRARAAKRSGTVREFFFRHWDAKRVERTMLIGRHGMIITPARKPSARPILRRTSAVRKS